MNNALYVWEDNLGLFPDEGMVKHLDMDKLMKWTSRVREHWMTNGPAPSTWKKEGFPNLRIFVSEKVPVPDHLACGSVRIASPRLQKLLESLAGSKNIEFHPVTIVHGNKRLEYFHYNVLAVEDPIDYQRSDLKMWPEEDGGGIEAISRIRVKEDFHPMGKIFVIPKMETLKVVTEELKSAIEAAECTGSFFIELDGYDDLWMTRPGYYRD